MPLNWKNIIGEIKPKERIPEIQNTPALDLPKIEIPNNNYPGKYKPGYPYAQTNRVVESNGGVIVATYDPGRILTIISNHSSNIVYVHFSETGGYGSGMRLNADGGTLWIGRSTDMPYTGPVRVVGNVGGSWVGIINITENSYADF